MRTLPLSQIPPKGDSLILKPFFFLSYPVMGESFLQLWLFKISSLTFQLVFYENCSTYRCIFDVIVGGGELHFLLLLFYLDIPPTFCVFEVIFYIFIYISSLFIVVIFDFILFCLLIFSLAYFSG